MVFLFCFAMTPPDVLHIFCWCVIIKINECISRHEKYFYVACRLFDHLQRFYRDIHMWRNILDLWFWWSAVICYTMINQPGELFVYSDSAAICIAYNGHEYFRSAVLWIDFYDKKIYITWILELYIRLLVALFIWKYLIMI